MPPAQALSPLAFGALFIVLGLIPGPLARFEEALLRFQAAFFQTHPVRANQASPLNHRLPGQLWLAVLGAIVVVAVLAFYPA